MTILVALLVGLVPPSPAEGDVDYLRDVKPLLARQCVGCHGAEKPRGGLRLDTAAAALKGGRGGPSVVPGNSGESPLYTAVVSDDDGERMPLKRPKLSDAEATTLRTWIDAGAHYPADEVPTSPPPPHWAFVAPVRPEVPAVADGNWPRNPIDGFIAARLDRDGIRPAPEADRATLVRRLSLDLVGLPPTPEEVDAFVADDAPDAYEKLVDRLLASPHYGERWGRVWLDAARYADSNGYSIDAPRQIWPYRDWVIDALNRDQPFDEFVVDQVAGDLRPDASLAQRVATGLHRNTQINQEGGIDPEQFRVEAVIDRVNTTGTVFLGLTIGCAQCHDHKYDPISQKDYYRLFAFFNNSDDPDLPVASPEEVARRDAFLKKADEALDHARQTQPELVEAAAKWVADLDMVGRQKQTLEVRTAIDLPPDRRTEDQHRAIFAAFADQAPAAKKLKQALNKIKRDAPAIVTTMVVRERATPRETHLLLGGDFTRPADVVEPGTPQVLPALPTSTPTRMDLARWLVDPKNPLTARVAVNRIWQEHFGRGLVETENDFGTQGSPPSHPALLDWLATEFVASGWSQKAIHRLIVTSATYRQSSRARPDLLTLDPTNLLLARQARLRVDAELVRDAALRASGLLNPAVGGPSVFPPQPDGVMNLGQMRREWKPDDGPDRYRRGLYTYFWRATPHPLLMVFDAPDATRTCTRRPRSNTPLQALTLLNDPAFIEFAQALADRAGREAPADADRLRRIFRLCLGRAPSPTEADRLAALLAQGRADSPEPAAWTAVARVLLNLDEFITRE